MDRTERFYKIEMMIRAQGCTSFEQMQAVLEVSRATLKRDLQYLRTRMDAPIVYDRIDNSYKLQADPRDQRQVAHQLPGVWFSEREIHAMLTMHQLIQGLDAGGVLARHLHPLRAPARTCWFLAGLKMPPDLRRQRRDSLAGVGWAAAPQTSTWALAR